MASRAWKCEVCGYVHSGLEPAQTCPVCGVGSDMFTEFAIASVSEAKPGVTDQWLCTICNYLHTAAVPPNTCPVCGATHHLFEAYGEGGPVSARPDIRKLVIIGASIAGVTAAEAAREANSEVEITLVSREAGLPYYRLNLSRLLAKEIEPGELALHDAAWFEENNIALLHGEALRLDLDELQLELRDGTVLPFDRVILANGAHPFVPPIPGATRDHVFSVRVREDVDQLSKIAEQSRRCVVIGGGLLGLEVAGALSRRHVKTTVLEGYGWLLPRQLHRPAGDRLAQHLNQLGIHVVTDTHVEEICGDDSVSGVRLKNKEFFAADFVVMATGVRPNSHLARRADIKVGRGVLVDDAMFTSTPRVLAAGDVAEHRGQVWGIWPTAYAQGRIAGMNAIGGRAEYEAIPPANRLKVLDVDMFSIGQIAPSDGSFQVYDGEHDGASVRMVTRDGRLQGAVLFGDTKLAGLIKDAIEKRRQLPELTQLLDRLPDWRKSLGIDAL